jgi:ribonuclease BN (tRNA processing enzyme)
MEVIFLGTNGWYNTKFGNTVCILVKTKNFSLILDAGDGIYKIGDYIDWKKPCFLFLSHLHLDHISGLHILTKFEFKKPLIIFTQKGTKKFLNFLIRQPFIASIKDLSYKIEIKEISAGKYHSPINIETRYLNHISPVLGFRFKIGKREIAYCTDSADCKNLRDLAKKVNLLILECVLKPGEKNSYWPHMDPLTASKIAKEEKVKRLIFTHFNPVLYETYYARKKIEKVAKKFLKTLFLHLMV